MKRTLSGNWKTKRVYINNRELIPNGSLKYVNHSPDGFNWGYGGSGPSQLAFAILYELTDDSDNSFLLYQEFKKDFIVSLPQNDFKIEFDLEEWIDNKFRKSMEKL